MKFRKQQGPMRRCEHMEFVDGPHPGCAEFAAPDEMRCREESQYIIVVKATDTTWGTGRYKATWRLCPWHATELIDELRRNTAAGDVKDVVVKIINAKAALAITEHFDRDFPMRVQFAEVD